MATYERRVLEIRRVEYHVPASAPWGAAWTEVYKAVAAIHEELREAGELREGEDAADDRITMEPRDDVIVVSYEQRISAVQP